MSDSEKSDCPPEDELSQLRASLRNQKKLYEELKSQNESVAVQKEIKELELLNEQINHQKALTKDLQKKNHSVSWLVGALGIILAATTLYTPIADRMEGNKKLADLQGALADARERTLDERDKVIEESNRILTEREEEFRNTLKSLEEGFKNQREDLLGKIDILEASLDSVTGPNSDRVQVAEVEQDLAELRSQSDESFRLAGIETETAQQDIVIGQIQRNILLEPNDPESYNSLGDILEDRGEIDEAIDSYQEAILLAPENRGYHNSLAWALSTRQEITQEEKQQALESALLAVAGNEVPEYIDTLAAAYAANDNFEKAIETQTLAIENLGPFATSAQRERFSMRLDLYSENRRYIDENGRGF